MSTHSVDVVKIEEILVHPNADALDIIRVFDYPCVVKKGDFKKGDLAAFFHPETLVETGRPEFAFLAAKAKYGTKARIRSIRLRGERSYGLLVKAPEGSKAGQNLWEHYGCTWYEPPPYASPTGRRLLTGLGAKPPAMVAPVPDPENIRKYKNIIQPGDSVVYTAKLHGSFFRATYQDGQFFVGSKNHWRLSPDTQMPNPEFKHLSWWQSLVNFFTKRVSKTMSAPDSSWWVGFRQNPWLGAWLKSHPDYTVMGELVGATVQGADFHYGHSAGEYGVYVFAVHDGKDFVGSHDLHFGAAYRDLQKVECLYAGPHNMDTVRLYADRPETHNQAGHLREGVVVTPYENLHNDTIGRAVLKYISDGYLDRT